MGFPVLAKASALGLVLLALCWALSQVSGVVAERNERLHEAQRSVSDSLAGSQLLVGPVLQRSCTERWEVELAEGKDRKRVTEERSFVLRSLPRQLSIQADTKTDLRYRGIFQVNGYVLNAKLTGDWPDTNALVPTRQHEGSRLSCDAALIWAGVSDARGIRSARINLQGNVVQVGPGVSAAVAGQTFQATWPGADGFDGKPVRAVIELELVGTEDLAFVPIGDSTEVKLVSDWPHPSFNGRFLPRQREVTSSGFTATWQLSTLATRAPQQLLAAAALCRPRSAVPVQSAPPNSSTCIESFGVSFIEPVSVYALSDRATKYGLLFVALTFVAVGLVEGMRRLKVHPIQYLLVGSALTIFFLLLVSLSEHLPFGWAYLAASAACTALLTFYGVHVLGGSRQGLGFGAGIAALYGTLYILLQQEQTALVIGSVLVFGALAGIMVVTRKMDWYGLFAQIRSGGRAEGETPAVAK